MFFNWFIDLIRKITPSFSSSLCHVSTYTRELPINLDRMYENAIDWEHLPWLHSATFSHVEMLEAGDWGWKIKAALTPKSVFNTMTLELRLDRTKNRWITKTLSGYGKGTEIWTHAIPIADNKIKVIVDFYIPKIPKVLKPMYAENYETVYAKLYDEDLWMMAGRQKELDKLEHAVKVTDISPSLNLGTWQTLKPQMPYVFDFNQHAYRLVKLNGELIAHSTVCPHMLGPLNDANIEEGILECPWHGYQFDLKTRKCISGQRCRMAPAPKIEHNTQTGEIVVHLKKRQ